VPDWNCNLAAQKGDDMKRELALTLMLICTLFPAALCWGDQDFFARLSGSEEVPKVKTPASGSLEMTLSGDRLEYVLKADRITSPTAAMIHKGRRGENGAPVAGLFGAAPVVGAFSGVLAQGTLSEQSLMGELQGKRVEELVRLIKSGNAYVNILTSTYPAGEIRGEIKAQ
jgi:hypothetical protein